MNGFALVIFVALPLLGLALGARKLPLVFAGRRVTGRIVAFEALERGPSPEDERTIRYPVVEFADEAGRRVRRTMSGENPHGENAVGEPVKLVHPRGRPAAAVYDDKVTLWLVPALCFGPAVVFGLFSVAVLAWARLAGPST